MLGMVTVGKPSTTTVSVTVVVPQPFVTAILTKNSPGFENDMFGVGNVGLPILTPALGFTDHKY